MSTPSSGAANRVAAGRYTNFEDSNDEAQPTLPPRSRARRPDPTSRTNPAAVEPTGSVEPGRKTASSAAPSSKSPGDKIRPSNVHIPVDLLGRVHAKCAAEGLSHGDIIIVALEEAHPRLTELINPPATAGGGLFAARRTRTTRSSTTPLTPLNYRLRVDDFVMIDQIVEEFGASSRGHLITVALRAYFGEAD